ncbi:MAG: DUF6515 family protein [Rikenellaceae bacterium]
MRLDTFKISAIVALGVFVLLGEASASNSIQAPSSKKKKEVVSSKNKVSVSPSNVVYKKNTPVVRVVRTLPSSAVVVKNKGVNIYINNGLFYRKEPDRYISIVAPVGLRVKTLPLGYAILNLLDKTYFYYEGTYYRQVRNEYEVVDAPEDIIVYTLPAEAELITIDGSEYYLYNGRVYSIVITPDGKAFKMSGEIALQ